MGLARTTENLTVAPTTVRQTSQLRLAFLFHQKQKYRTGYTRAAENSELRPFAIDIHTQNDTIRA
jgi:hypothetical protein